MQPRRRRQQERHKFVYLTMKNNSFARFARAVLFWTFGRRSSSFHDRETISFAFVWTTINNS